MSGTLPSARQYTPDSTAWISNIARIPRDQMYVHVHARLARGLSDVHANVVAVRRMIVLDETLRLIQKTENTRLLFGSHVKEAGDMALWNDEQVSTAERIVVMADVREFILQDDIFRSTQLANRGLGRSCHSYGTASV